VEAFLTTHAVHAKLVTVAFFHFRHYPVDPDDVMFLLCAINGRATHLVSYDNHLRSLSSFYESELKICEPLVIGLQSWALQIVGLISRRRELVCVALENAAGLLESARSKTVRAFAWKGWLEKARASQTPVS